MKIYCGLSISTASCLAKPRFFRFTLQPGAVETAFFKKVSLLGLLLFLLTAPHALFGQTKKELEDKRKRILRDIALTDKLLQKPPKNAKTRTTAT
jgi:hypothetical protein